MDVRAEVIKAMARERLRKKYLTRMPVIADQKLAFIVPLLDVFEKKPRVVGCAAKLAIGERRFLLTAAHVVDEMDKAPVVFQVGTDWQQVVGRSKRNTLPEGVTRDSDTIDAAVIELDRSVRSVLPGPFLSVSSLDVNDSGEPSKYYLIVGYPNSRTRKNFERRTFMPRPLRFATTPPIDTPPTPAASIRLVLDFDRKNVVFQDGEEGTAPKPDGMSGCGVWSFPSLLRPHLEHRDRLVAIFTDHVKTSKALEATRVAVHIETMRSEWPELGPSLPRSRFLRINVRK